MSVYNEDRVHEPYVYIIRKTSEGTILISCIYYGISKESKQTNKRTQIRNLKIKLNDEYVDRWKDGQKDRSKYWKADREKDIWIGGQMNRQMDR